MISAVRICSAWMIAICLAGSAAYGDIFKWEYIDPADPSQGKRQSTTLTHGGAGKHAVPAADLRSLNLDKAYLPNANLAGAKLIYTRLQMAELKQS